MDTGIVGHGGAIYGFATELEMMPDDKLGVVVIASLDSSNSVVTRIAHEALNMALAAAVKIDRANSPSASRID